MKISEKSIARFINIASEVRLIFLELPREFLLHFAKRDEKGRGGLPGAGT